MKRMEAADAVCFAITLRMAFGFSADEILHDEEVSNGMQTWANLAAYDGLLVDDDPAGVLVSHAVPFPAGAPGAAA